MSMKMLKLSLVLSMMMPINSYAIFNYTRLHIVIKNNTPHTCQLYDHHVSGGKYIYHPPGQILPGDLKHFDAEDVSMGPRVTLVYRCGEYDSGYKNVAFKSTKHGSFLMGGKVYGHVIEHLTDDGITATPPHPKGASTFLDREGRIEWTINYTHLTFKEP